MGTRLSRHGYLPSMRSSDPSGNEPCGWFLRLVRSRWFASILVTLSMMIAFEHVDNRIDRRIDEALAHRDLVFTCALERVQKSRPPELPADTLQQCERKLRDKR